MHNIFKEYWQKNLQSSYHKPSDDLQTLIIKRNNQIFLNITSCNESYKNAKACLKLMGSVSSARTAAMTITREGVNDLIKSDKVVIFSKSFCPYCKMAKDVFDKLKQAYTAIELDKRDDMDEFQDILGEITGARSVPRVFVNGEFIGGGTDVKKLHESGELAKKL